MSACYDLQTGIWISKPTPCPQLFPQNNPLPRVSWRKNPPYITCVKNSAIYHVCEKFRHISRARLLAIKRVIYRRNICLSNAHSFFSILIFLNSRQFYLVLIFLHAAITALAQTTTVKKT